MKRKKKIPTMNDADSQKRCFTEAAHGLECDEDEGRFNATLKRIVSAKSERDHRASGK